MSTDVGAQGTAEEFDTAWMSAPSHAHHTQETAERARKAWPQLATLALVSVGLLALILAPRLRDLDALVTADEPLWVGRSANFYQALQSGNLGDTYQFVHPGVTVMWFGAIGYAVHIPNLHELTGGQFSERGRGLQNVIVDAGYSMADVLVHLRQMLIFASAFVLVSAFLCLTKLVSIWPAAIAVGFVSLDPLHIGLTRLLHVDGLSANLMLLTIVAFCWHQATGSRAGLVISGVAFGLACLTRAANGILAPIVVLIAVLDLFLDRTGELERLRTRLRQLALKLAMWSIIGGAVFVICWPAMWVAPLTTIQHIWDGNADLASGGAELNQFFRGTATKSDPGWTYYPTVLMYRTSPLTVIGLIVALIAWVRPAGIGRAFPHRLGAHLCVFAGIYLFLISLSAKKFDRYVLPAMVSVDLIAGLAWVSFAIWAARRLHAYWPGTSGYATASVVAGVLFMQAGLAASVHPIYIDEANPLLGGTAQARQAFSFNWGEGGREIAAAISELDGYPDVNIVAGPWPVTIDYYLPTNLTLPIYSAEPRGAAQWREADYLIVTYPQVQRRLYPEALLAWFDANQPVQTVNDDHGVYARIYDLRNLPLPDLFLADPRVVDWGGIARLAGVDSQKAARQGRGCRLNLTFEALGKSGTIAIQADLVASDGTVVSTRLTEADIDESSSPVTVSSNLDIPSDLTLGTYSIVVSVRDATTGITLTARQPVSGETVGVPVTIASVRIIEQAK